MSFWRSLVAACGLVRSGTPADEHAAVQPMKLVVGLGNHGSEYEGTRHNVGYEVIDRLANKLGALQFRRQFAGRIGSVTQGGEKLLLLKPETYMNRSGQSVQAALEFHRLSAENLLVICDDLNLPVGKIRIRRGGSDGGQKGLRSLTQHLGTTEFPRLRVGIGAAPAGVDATKYVLDRFTRNDRSTIDEAIDRAADAVLVWREAGIVTCMNRFN